MSESFSWPEGTVYIYTGSATASAIIAYAENTQVNLTRGWDNRASLSGLYRDHLTGQMAQVSVGVLTTLDWTVFRMFESATATHFHFRHTGIGSASAGLFLFSGRLDSMAFQGNNGNLFKFTLSYHCNAWSGYGNFS